MAETITYSDLRRGTIIELDGEAYSVVEFKHVVMQARTPTLTLKLRQLRTGKTFERNLPGDKRLTRADVEHKQAQYLYSDGHHTFFMDTDTFDQFPLLESQLGDQAKFLKEGDTISLLSHRGEPVSVELPTTVDLTIVETPPSFKGNTAHSGKKPATLETGLVLRVPMHVNQGQMIRVDTRTGEYVSTVS